MVRIVNRSRVCREEGKVGEYYAAELVWVYWKQMYAAKKCGFCQVFCGNKTCESRIVQNNNGITDCVCGIKIEVRAENVQISMDIDL